MQTPVILPPPRKRGRGAIASCGECRRRKQKCCRTDNGPCRNCARRYPPVECIFKSDLIFGSKEKLPVSAKMMKLEAVINLESSPKGSWKSIDPEILFDGALNTTRESSTSTLGSTPAQSISSDLEAECARVSTPSTDKAVPVSLGFNSAIVRRSISPDPADTVPYGATSAYLNGPTGANLTTSRRNAELLHFFHHFVVPNFCSVDGNDTSPFFKGKIFPWLIPNMAILMASSTRSTQPEFQNGKPSETLSVKTNVLATINKLLQQDFASVARDALSAVVHLVIIEWWWGNTANLSAHLNGARQMLKLQGGLDNLKDPVLQRNLLLTDYELACCFERDLYWLDPVHADDIESPINLTYPAALRSPLIANATTFRESTEDLGLSPDAAEILDAVRPLTIAITSPFSKVLDIKTMAFAFLTRIESSPPLSISPSTPEIFIITSTIRLAAQIYVRSITARQPLSQTWDTSLREQLFSHILAVPLSSWNRILGILFWILLVACPGSGDGFQGKWLKKKMAVAGMAVGLKDLGLSISCLRAFLKVQRWCDGGGMKEEVGG